MSRKPRSTKPRARKATKAAKGNLAPGLSVDTDNPATFLPTKADIKAAAERAKGEIIKPAKKTVDPIVQALVPEDVPSLIVPRPTSRPFDREAGEIVGQLGRDFQIVPNSKWNDTTLMAEAVRRAALAYGKTSAAGIQFTDDTILIQEYHSQDRIAFIFAAWARQIGMRKWDWIYLPVVMKLTPPLKAHMVLTGRWPSSTRH